MLLSIWQGKKKNQTQIWLKNIKNNNLYVESLYYYYN